MKPRILVVDDEEQVRRVVRTKMEQCGYSVDEAGDGAEAIKKLEVESFDLVIADIIMPERNGLEVIMHLRKKRPGTKVIAISAPGNDLFLSSAEGLGAAFVLAKPFELAELASTVEQLLSDKLTDRPLVP